MTSRPPTHSVSRLRLRRLFEALLSRGSLAWNVLLLCSLAGVVFSAGPSTCRADEKPDLEGNRYFEMHVRPLFVEKCGQCHGKEQPKGGFRLDSREALLAGGESGPALVPGSPDESLLIEAIRYESYEMPPSGKLSDAEIAVIVKWVELGAPWPGGASPSPVGSEQRELFTEEDRRFWSLQPLKECSPPDLAEDQHSGFLHNEIDRFILQKLTENQIAPTPEAERLSLLRRLTFDLTGLPPTPEEIETFLADDAPTAYEDLVDRLLASPRFGEHWARFWLDLVRYAESDGYRQDAYRPNSWHYRDYVIEAFNSDKPFSRFIQEQIAGDEIAPDDPAALVATGFLRHGIYEYNQRDAREQWRVILNDLTDTVSDVFLGLGMGCARCHDHKFDPILQKDYYRLQAFFANVALQDEMVVATADERAEYQQKLAVWEEQTAEIRRQIDEIEQPHYEAIYRADFVKFPKDVQEQLTKPTSEFTSYDRQLAHLIDLRARTAYGSLPKRIAKQPKVESRWKALREELAAFDSLKPAPLPHARGVTDFHAASAEVYIPRKERLGQILPGFLTIFDPEPATLVSFTEEEQIGERRATLADWLSQDDNPLVTRVIVNRIWKEHFGTGIVPTPSDFGHLGQPPSHPELLDWLAVNFTRNGWSLKWLHKQIVMSGTYRQSAQRSDAEAERIDPDNRLLWRGSVKRLSAEQYRDAVLFVTGELDPAVGGPSLDHSKSLRRSIYHKVIRNKPDPLLVALDFPDRITSLAERNTTTTSAQSLMLLNGDWILRRAQSLARLVEKRVPHSREQQIAELYRLTLSRSPTPGERQRIEEYLAQENLSSPLVDLCHVLLNSNEFLYTD